MKILRLFIKTLLLGLALCIAPFTFAFWLCCWTPFVVVSITLMNLVEFAKGTDDFFDYNQIWWFFWLFIMWNFEKSEEYI